jgi:hypothetical protein
MIRAIGRTRFDGAVSAFEPRVAMTCTIEAKPLLITCVGTHTCVARKRLEKMCFTKCKWDRKLTQATIKIGPPIIANALPTHTLPISRAAVRALARCCSIGRKKKKKIEALF